MKKHHILQTVAAFLTAIGTLGLASVAAAQDKPLTSLPTERIFVHSMKKLDAMAGATSVDWSGENGRLLVGKPGANRYFNVYSVTPQGFRRKPLTLGRQWSTSVQHKGDASWDPTGEFFAFVVQNRGSSSYTGSMPGVGLNCNVWIGSRDGDGPWQITDHSTTNPPKAGVVAPHFSPDGSKLVWAGVTVTQVAGATLGQRKIYMADVSVGKGRKASISNVQALQPGANKDYYHPHGFSPDGSRLIFAGNLEKDVSRLGMDLYTFDIRTSKVVNLTQTPQSWDEHGVYSPDGKKIAYASSETLNLRYFGGGVTRWKENLRTELWIMNADGSEPKRLTFFHEFGAPEHFRRRTFVGDLAWGPEGKTIAICLNRETGPRDMTADLILVSLGVDAPPEGVKIGWAEKGGASPATRSAYGKPGPRVR